MKKTSGIKKAGLLLLTLCLMVTMMPIEGTWTFSDTDFSESGEVAESEEITEKQVSNAIANVQPSAEIESTISGWIFLHGNAVILTAGATEGTTKVYKDINANGVLDEGETPVTLAAESGSAEEGYDLSEVEIYGAGTEESTHTGDILVTMTGGKIKALVGSFACEVTGNFFFHMTGGEVADRVCSTGTDDLHGNVSITIAGKAKVGTGVFGGGNNETLTIDGNVDITVKDQAEIAYHGGFGAKGLFAGGYQSITTIKGTSTINIEGGTVHRLVAADADNMAATFEKTVTINIFNGNFDDVYGLYNADTKAKNVIVNVQGGVFDYGVSGTCGTVTNDLLVNVKNCKLSGNIIGLRLGNAKVENNATVNIGENVEVSENVYGNYAGNTKNLTVNIHQAHLKKAFYGLVNGAIAESLAVALTDCEIDGKICTRNSSNAPANCRIELSGGLTGTGTLYLLADEHITVTGDLTGKIPLNAAAINTAGALVAAQGSAGVQFSQENFELKHENALRLVNGLTGKTSVNLYFGSDVAQGSGSVEVKGETSLHVQTDMETNKDDFFSSEDISAMLQGKDVKLELSVNDATNVDESVSQAIAASPAAKGLTTGAYLDIQVKKYIDNQEETTLSSLPAPVRITIDISENLRKANRIFSILRTHEHNGTLEVEKLSDLDNNADTITFETDKFSIYALMYEDKAEPAPPSGGGGSVHVHSFGPEWVSDEIGHWQACLCGVRTNRISHTAGEWIIDKEATETAEGSRHQACTTCGYVMKTEAISATGEAIDDAQKQKQELIKKIRGSKFIARSSWTTLHGKRAIKVRWFNPAGSGNLPMDEYDRFEIFRSTKRYSGYTKKPIFVTTNQYYINNKELKIGTRYYYKVRGCKTVDGQKYYSQWSWKAWRRVWGNWSYYRR